MSNADDGGYAFPSEMPTANGRATRGMSLRDYFAGQALTGLVEYPHRAPDAIARFAYALADAMLKERGG